MSTRDELSPEREAEIRKQLHGPLYETFTSFNLAGFKHADSIRSSLADRLVDSVMPVARGLQAESRAAALSEAIEAARGEYLTDNTGTPEDDAYNQAVSDVVAAIGALATALNEARGGDR